MVRLQRLRRPPSIFGRSSARWCLCLFFYNFVENVCMCVGLQVWDCVCGSVVFVTAIYPCSIEWVMWVRDAINKKCARIMCCVSVIVERNSAAPTRVFFLWNAFRFSMNDFSMCYRSLDIRRSHGSKHSLSHQQASRFQRVSLCLGHLCLADNARDRSMSLRCESSIPRLHILCGLF